VYAELGHGLILSIEVSANADAVPLRPNLNYLELADSISACPLYSILVPVSSMQSHHFPDISPAIPPIPLLAFPFVRDHQHPTYAAIAAPIFPLARKVFIWYFRLFKRLWLRGRSIVRAFSDSVLEEYAEESE
jgi:hypothetical protein